MKKNEDTIISINKLSIYFPPKSQLFSKQQITLKGVNKIYNAILRSKTKTLKIFIKKNVIYFDTCYNYKRGHTKIIDGIVWVQKRGKK